MKPKFCNKETNWVGTKRAPTFQEVRKRRPVCGGSGYFCYSQNEDAKTELQTEFWLLQGRRILMLLETNAWGGSHGNRLTDSCWAEPGEAKSPLTCFLSLAKPTS